jgi:peptide/nickel transport system substrate-binding protein
MKEKRSSLLVGLLLSLILALSACAAPAVGPAPDTGVAPAQTGADAAPAADTAAGPQGELRVALSTMPNSIYGPRTAERNATNAAAQLYDALAWVDDDGDVVPALAERWEISEDGLEYTFYLRQDVTFHNGEPFNADAVVFTWEAGKDPSNQYAYTYEYATNVEKIDDYTVKMTTSDVDPLFLRQVAAGWTMVPPLYFQEVGGADAFEQAPVGTGPFRFVEMVRGDRIVYEANPDYWQEGLPRVDRLIFRPIPESSTRVAAIQTGEVDIVQRLSAEEAGSLDGVANVRVISYPVDRVYYIAFDNLTTGVDQPTMDPLVRQAMNLAVDRQAIVDALFNGQARLATGLVTPANLGYDESLEPFPYDPERAMELLAEAGYPDGFDMDMACPVGAYTNFEQVCEAVQGFLGEVGINVNLELMESGLFWNREAAKELPPLFGDSWSSTLGEAINRLTGALGGWDASYSAWSDPVIDDYIAQIEVTVDDSERAQLYIELQRYMVENPPFIYLYQPMAFEAVNTAVQNYNPRPAEDYFLKGVSVER